MMIEVVRNHEDSEFLLVVKLLKKLIKRLLADVVEIIGGFVEDEKLLGSS